MPRYPHAAWRPITSNYTPGGMGTINGVVLHIMQGTLEGTDAWFHNPAAQVSAHFGIGVDGTVYQWVDTADRAWHAAAANPHWLGIEHEGRSGAYLSAAQLRASAAVIAWAAATHRFPLRAARTTSETGIAYHALGGAAWGGHPDCPGQGVIHQIGQLISTATAKGKGDIVTPDDINAIAEATCRKLGGTGFNARGWTYGDSIQKIREGVAKLLAQPATVVDEAELAKELLTSLSPQAIAAAVEQALPAELARQVADELAHRLAG